MKKNDILEREASEAFSRQSEVFDEIYSSNLIIEYKRERTRQAALKDLGPSLEILELNAGTGEDAVYFASKGYKVHATDISEGMLDKLNNKVKLHKLEHLVSSELCSFNQLDNLRSKGPYDLIFSNFAGLNCSENLDKVLASLDPLLKPGGKITLVVMPPFCLWETLMIFKGKIKTAFRRFSSKGAMAHIEGIWFRCWYYKPSYIIEALGKDYELTGMEGLCTIVPPSYLESFPVKYPRLYGWLQRAENRLKSAWPWRSMGDYYILSFRKKGYKPF
jgi:ubiquinone/menaquinone biosynthesis C-methylase UbiE